MSPVLKHIPEELKREAEVAERVSVGIDVVRGLGEQSLFSCPDCGGGLWSLKDGSIERYRCHVGHSYSERDLIVKQAEQAEATLWVAIRIMEERRNMLRKLETEHLGKGFKRIASDHGERAKDLEGHIDKLKQIVFGVQITDHT